MQSKNKSTKKAVSEKFQKKVNKIEKKMKKMSVGMKKNKGPIKRHRPKNTAKSVARMISSRKQARLSYYAALIDPWSANGVKLPQIGENYSCTAKVVSYFSLPASTNGTFFMYFDPNFIASAGNYKTSFLYNNSASLTGASAISSLYTAGTTATMATVPSSLVSKCRLVSAAMKVIPKISMLNLVGTALACVDYGDYDLYTPSSQVASLSLPLWSFTSFSNIRSAAGGVKYDLTPTDQSVFFNWYPVDPLSDVFVDAGNYMVDNNSKDAGGSPRWVLGLQDLPSGAMIDFEIVWNIEYLPQPTLRPWLGSSPLAPTISEFDDAKDRLALQKLISNGYIPASYNKGGVTHAYG